MKKLLSIVLILTMLFTLQNIIVFAEENESSIEYFVSSDAGENGDGSIGSPFHSLEQARDAIRELKKQGAYPEKGVTVTLRGGTYPRKSMFVLTAEDSGTETAPIIYRSYPNETAEIVGGTEITLADCKVSKSDKINESVRGKVYSYNLSENGIAGYDSLQVTGHSAHYLQIQNLAPKPIPVPEVYFNNETMSMARYPNEGYMTIGQVVEKGDIIRNWADDYIGKPEYVAPEDRNNPPVPCTFKVNDARVKEWGDADSAWVHGYWYWDWSDQTIPVRSIDVNAGTIQTELPSAYGVLQGQRFYIYNLIEELDVPGEWFYDEKTGEFYIYPKDSNPESKILLSFSSEKLLDMNGTSNIYFKNITFKGTRDCAISMIDCNNIKVSYCTVSNVSSSGIVIENGKNISVEGCELTNLGGKGVILYGGDVNTLEPGNNSVINCWIHDFGRINRTLNGAVDIKGVGNIVKNNLIHDAPHFAIGFSGNDHIIENNEIFSVLQETADAGVIYAGRNCIARGTVIRGNLIHDIYSDRGDAQVYAIYLDDQFCGVTVEENVIYNLGGKAVFINGGRDNTIINNIFYNVSSAGVRVAASGRAENWNTHVNFEETHALHQGLHKTQAYAKYPHLATIEEDDMLNPKYNVIQNNVCYKVPSALDINTLQEYGSTLTEKEIYAQNTIDAGYTALHDPGFTSLEKGNFNLKEENDILVALPNFKTRNYSAAGLITSRLKANLSKDAIAMAINKPVAYVNWNRALIDEENVKITPVLVDGTTYVPVRFLAEMLGADITWDGNATIKNNEKTLVLSSNSSIAYMNGTEFNMEKETILLNDRMHVPLRACGELFDKKVMWDDVGVIIISDESLEEYFDEEMLRDLYNRM